MDWQIETAEGRTNIVTKQSYSSGHLMCRSSLWGVAGFLGCAYFAWISFGHITRSEYEWPHDAWTAATYVVWILLLAGLALDTRCFRERIFFGVLVVNFIIGFGLTLWHNIPSADVRSARIGTGALWALAALVSLATLGNPREMDRKGV
ncbi:MAG TPA: hypothetical protein VNU74_03520 [Terriglobales bacterium]|jgi:hypothetical protein|nr:hypothetical protein [Terriglobales bacterium]